MHLNLKLATLALAGTCGLTSCAHSGMNPLIKPNPIFNRQSAASLPGKMPKAKPQLGTLRRFNQAKPVLKHPQLKANSLRIFDTGDYKPEYRYQDLQWFLRKTKAPEAWKVTQGHPEMIVAVLDTGVDYNHPALKDRVIKGFDFGDSDTDPMDGDSHGTHVAGIIAANGAARGMAPGVKILAIKVFATNENSPERENGLASAIRQAVEMGASIINMSLGASTLYDCGNQRALNSAMDEAFSEGVSIVTAAGNETYDFIAGQCSVQQNINQIPVIATNEMDRITTFSNYGNLDHPKAISAPGMNIFSTVPTAVVCNDDKCDMPYDYMDGTSMASPVVAGALALIRSAMYDDYVQVAEKLQAEGRLKGNRVLSLREFFHTRGRGARWQLDLAITPSHLSERLLFSHTNQPATHNPQALNYEGSRDPIFGFGRIDVGAAVASASKVFSAYMLE